MTREQLLEGLSKVNLCVVDLTATYDMGIQFTMITSTGVSIDLGDIGSWPNYKLKVTPDIIALQSSLRKGENVTNEQMMENIDIKRLCTYNTLVEFYTLGDKHLNKCLELLRKALIDFNFNENEYYYVYNYIEDYDTDIRFFNTYEGLRDYFKEQWNSECMPFDDIDDGELENYYNQAKEKNWESLPMIRYDEE